MKHAHAKSPRDLYLHALMGRAHVRQFTGQYPQALQDWQAASRATRDPKYRFEFYQGVGTLYERLGRFQSAFASIGQAIRLCRRYPRLARPHVMQRIQVHLLLEREDYPAAVKLGEEIMRRRISAMPDNERTRLYTSLGTACLAMGAYDRALDYYMKTRCLSRRLNHLEGISVADNNLSLVYWKMGDYKKALKHSRAALDVREKIGYMFGISASLNNLGLINDEMGNYEEALMYYEKALAAFKRLNDIYGVSVALTNIGSIYHEIQGDVNKAFGCHLRSLELARQSGDRFSEIEGLLAMSEIYWLRKGKRAYGHAVEAIDRLIKGMRSEELGINHLLARIRLHAWNKDRVLRDRAIQSLLDVLGRSRNRLQVIEGVAGFIEICHAFGMDGWTRAIAGRVKGMQAGWSGIESPLKRTKILRALVKYHLLARDRVKAGFYHRQWEQSARQYRIRAEQKEIDRLRPAVG